MLSFSISNSNVLPENLWVSAEFLLLSTGPLLYIIGGEGAGGVCAHEGHQRPEPAKENDGRKIKNRRTHAGCICQVKVDTKKRN